jgi:hypothetical protein
LELLTHEEESRIFMISWITHEWVYQEKAGVDMRRASNFIRSGLSLVAMFLGLGAAFLPSQALAATQTLCAGSTIPEGWVLKDMYRDSFKCTNSLSTYQWNVWVIESHTDKVEGTSMRVCVGLVPEGWLKSDITDSSTQCGRDSSARDNVWTIYKMKSADTRLTVCAGYVPGGWFKTDFYDHDTRCAGDPFVHNQDNVWVIERYDNAPEGTTLHVCVGFQPYDWVKKDIYTSSTKCGRYNNISNNVWVLSKIAATDTSLVTCAGYVPADFIKTDFYPQSYQCGLDYNSTTYNMWVVERYNTRPIGSTMKVCAGFLPTGWSRIGTSTSTTQCGRGTANSNIWTIRRDF